MPTSIPLLSSLVSRMQPRQPPAGGGALSQAANAMRQPPTNGGINPGGMYGGNVSGTPGGAPRAPLSPIPAPSSAPKAPSGPARMVKPSPMGGAPRPGGGPSLPPLSLPNRSTDFFAGMQRPDDARRNIHDPRQSATAEAKFRSMMNRNVGFGRTVQDVMERSNDPDAQRFLDMMNELNGSGGGGGDAPAGNSSGVVGRAVASRGGQTGGVVGRAVASRGSLSDAGGMLDPRTIRGR